ncbi:MAG: hypothetical protein AB8H47_02720 [Bacteroidia bacterium]
MQKLRPHIASLFLLLSFSLALPADYWHDCSHGEDIHWEQGADTELDSEVADCALCEYVSPDISLTSVAVSLVGNAPFWHAFTQNQVSPYVESLEYPSLRGPPLG